MEWLTEIGRRLRHLFRREQWENDLAEEMRLHLDLRAADQAAKGGSARDAEALAKRKFGNASLLREQSRVVWGWALWDALAQDVRYGFCSLASHKRFAAPAVLFLSPW